MGNRAKNDKGSILIDVENLLDVFEPAFMRMPKIRRIHGAAVRMEDAAYDLIHYFTIAYEMGNDDPIRKKHYVGQMLGAYGRMQSCFKRLIKLKRVIYSGWWEWLDFDSCRLCLIYKPEFSVNARLNLKYNLKIKKYNTK